MTATTDQRTGTPAGTPTGTVTFLFTDIEGSTAAWEAAPTAMPGLLARHDVLVRSAIERHGGYVFATGGDGFAVAFSGTSAALGAAVDAQRALRSEPWPHDLPIRVRMALNTGEVDERDGDYFGPAVNRTARLMATASGGQVVLSERTAGHLSDLPADVAVEARGLHQLKDLRRPELVSEMVIDGVGGPPLRSARPATERLPAIRTSFVGRRSELANLATLASDHRLVTLVGPGGTGKTRLAIEHAAHLTGEPTDGVWFVDLSTAGDDDLASLTLTTLGLPTGDWGRLRHWRAHLVIDNCEHVVDAAADLIEDLLDECPGLRLVATSREALAIPGEQVLQIGPMSTAHDATTPDDAPQVDGSDAIRLFVERARSIDAHFDPDDTELDDISELCRALDGLPLAIELAASRVGTTGIAELATSLLGAGPDRRDRRRVERHRSLRAAIRWSADLMDEPTRTVFRRLSVFEGGFTAEAATEVVADDSIDAARARSTVATLVEQSMIQATRAPTGPRMSMLETIRSFATDELDADEEAEVRRRHLAWVAGWSRSHALGLDVPGWFSPTTEIANQRAAMKFALDSGDGRAAIDVFADSLGSQLSSGLYDDIPALLAELRELPAAQDPGAARQLDACEMWLADVFGDFGTSHALADRFRSEDDDDARWYLASALVIHHFAATSPRDAARVLDEFEGRSGVVPMTSYLRAEIALGEARFADAVDAIFAAFDADDLVGVERRLRTGVGSDPVILADLALAFHLTDRSDEAAVVVDLLADTTVAMFSAYVPLLRAVVDSRTAPLDVTLDDLRSALALEQRWEPPLVVLDCLVAGALVASQIGRGTAAAEALGATKGMPQRSISGFGVRRELRRRLVAELGDDGWAAARERGGGRAPRDAFARLIEALAE